MQRTRNPEPALVRSLGLLYQCVLYAYPASFRREYGPLMLQLFRDEARSLSHANEAAGWLRFLLRTLLDLVKTIFTTHLEAALNLRFEGGGMSYYDTISTHADNPEELEQLYHHALKTGHKNAFQQAIDENYRTAPGNLLLAAWFHRLHYAANQARRFVVAWGWAIPLALLNAALFWLLSDNRFMLHIAGGPEPAQPFTPALLLWAAPLAACALVVYFAVAGRRTWRSAAIFVGLPLLLAAYAMFVYPRLGIRPFQEQYLTLTLFHVPLLAWACVGGFLIAGERSIRQHLHFLLKSLEVVAVGGVFAMAWFAFVGITIALFAALNVSFTFGLERLLFVGGLGAIAVLTPAMLYNPAAPPEDQTLAQGFVALLSVLMQALLPITLLVLVIYVGFIPANASAPFNQRDVLIVYNIMLFAVVGLLVGATLVRPAEIAPERDQWLRRQMMAVAVLALVVGLYALAAILYRTWNDRLTPNRLVFIGWNVINVGLLVLLLLLQWRAQAGQWLAGLYSAFRVGLVAYVVWGAAVVLVLPWLFGVNQGEVARMPASIQHAVFTRSAPVLLTCTGGNSDIYLLDGGSKHWIQNLDTFAAQGYTWDDVQIVPCADLNQLPDGTPIPADAGPAPQR